MEGLEPPKLLHHVRFQSGCSTIERHFQSLILKWIRWDSNPQPPKGTVLQTAARTVLTSYPKKFIILAEVERLELSRVQPPNGLANRPLHQLGYTSFKRAETTGFEPVCRFHDKAAFQAGAILFRSRFQFIV